MADRLVLSPASGVAVASAFARPLALPATGLEVAQFVALRDDYDPNVERPEHRSCNRRAANELKTSRDW